MYPPNGLSHGYYIGPQLCGLFYPSPTRPLRRRYSGSCARGQMPFLASLTTCQEIGRNVLLRAFSDFVFLVCAAAQQYRGYNAQNGLS